MPYDSPDLANLNLVNITELVASRKLPPVESWNPVISGKSEMRIAADGRWFHQDGEIKRPAMVRAFSGLLRRDADGQYWLVTPEQKLAIEVEDTPFIAVEMQSEGHDDNRALAFRLNSDDLVVAGVNNSIKMRGGLPYLHVRGGMWAKMTRSVYYELAEIALAENPDKPLVWSNGIAFPFGDLA